MLEINKIYNMDCIEGLKKLPDNSIDSIVTDPPYELGFMNKSWDKSGIAYSVELWKECLRVLKPGGHLLSFGGTRTYHRMACAIEDAGFEIRDQIQWIYGSGFPKSMNISKAIDKKAGAERKVVGVKPGHEEFVNRKTKGDTVFKDGMDGFDRPWLHDEEKRQMYHMLTAPATDEAKQWDGWGTALKPANEPIVLARKPLSEKTIVDNILKWNTGGLNIDDCRIEYQSEEDKEIINKKASKNPTTNYSDKEDKIYGAYAEDKASPANEIGRFPANVIFDEEAGMLLDEQSGIKQTTRHMSYKRSGGEFIDGIPSQPEKDWFKSETGGASRFFYCAKASKKEKGQFNNHPTVKPISLMQYLVRLITPPNGIVLDPFAGSGTTCLASIKENFNYIGFELDTTYCGIANERILNIV